MPSLNQKLLELANCGQSEALQTTPKAAAATEHEAEKTL